MYRVFISGYFPANFVIFLNSASSAAALVFYLSPESGIYFKIFEKTIFNEHPVESGACRGVYLTAPGLTPDPTATPKILTASGGTPDLTATPKILAAPGVTPDLTDPLNFEAPRIIEK